MLRNKMVTVTVSMKGRHIKRFKASPSRTKMLENKKMGVVLIGSPLVSSELQIHSHAKKKSTNPFPYIEPICDFDESYEHHGKNFHTYKIYIRNYAELLNEQEDEKTAQAHRMCKAIWILPEAYKY